MEEPKRDPKFALGIDLGTTYSCVAVARDVHTVEIIADEWGNRAIPSYVAFSESGNSVGEAAQKQAAVNPKNTVFDTKRLLGRQFTDPHVQKDMQLWPFKVVNERGRPVIEVEFKNESKRFKPEEVSSMVLGKLKGIAETHLGQSVKDAVVTVPAYFTDAQRQSTKDAGAIAGLNVLRIINEPTAAAIAYGLNNRKLVGERTVLIFDLGGGTFDVSLLGIEDGVFEVKHVAGDMHLGGGDFDQRLVEHCVREFRRKHGNGLTGNHRALHRLRAACERAKRVLSIEMTASIEIDSLVDGIDFVGTVTRAQFEDLCADYFLATLTAVERVLADAKFAKSEVAEVVLVGGSTRIPKIQQLLSNFFSGKELCLCVNPDESVAYGAAVQAAILTGNGGSIGRELMCTMDLTPLSLGIETEGTTMTKIVERNTTIPCRKTQTFSTATDGQTVVNIQIFEGERARTTDNHFLGRFELSGIPPAPRGVPRIAVQFDTDANGILHVSALEKGTGKGKQIQISNDTGRLSAAEIKAIVQDSERYKQEDLRYQERVKARDSLDAFIRHLSLAINDPKFGDQIGSEEKVVMNASVAATRQWMTAHAATATTVDLNKRKDALQQVSEPILGRLLVAHRVTAPNVDDVD